MTNTQTAWFGIFDEMYDTLVSFTPPGIHNPLLSAAITLQPNPATDKVVITCDGMDGNAGIILTNLTGQVVYTGTLAGKTKQVVDIRDFPAGMYSVRIQTPNFTQTKKLVVTE